MGVHRSGMLMQVRESDLETLVLNCSPCLLPKLKGCGHAHWTPCLYGCNLYLQKNLYFMKIFTGKPWSYVIKTGYRKFLALPLAYHQFLKKKLLNCGIRKKVSWNKRSKTLSFKYDYFRSFVACGSRELQFNSLVQNFLVTSSATISLTVKDTPATFSEVLPLLE